MNLKVMQRPRLACLPHITTTLIAMPWKCHKAISISAEFILLDALSLCFILFLRLFHSMIHIISKWRTNENNTALTTFWSRGGTKLAAREHSRMSPSTLWLVCCRVSPKWGNTPACGSHWEKSLWRQSTIRSIKKTGGFIFYTIQLFGFSYFF